jgi:aryl-alcohol dehydrogenase-like predicted oxidoreductase
MEYQQLGRSRSRISRLTLGPMTSRVTGSSETSGGPASTAARRQIDTALDAGVNPGPRTRRWWRSLWRPCWPGRGR